MGRRSKADPVNWAALGVHYKAGVMAMSEMAERFNVSIPAISKHARENDWTRDLSARLASKSAEKVAKKQVSKLTFLGGRKDTEDFILEVESEVQARIRLAHRKSVQRYRNLCDRLIEELERQTEEAPQYATLNRLLKEAGRGKPAAIEAAYTAVLSLPERSKTMKTLIESFRILVSIEREAFGITSEPQNVNVTIADSRAVPVDPIEAARLYTSLMRGDLK